MNSGMPEPQAETVVRQRVRLLERNLATKADIEMLRLETKAKTKANIELRCGSSVIWKRCALETSRQRSQMTVLKPVVVRYGRVGN